MKQFHFIVNPTAGGGAAQAAFAKVAALLDERGIPYSSVFTSAHGEATALAAQAVKTGHTCIVAVGGDGTVHEVASALVHSEAVLGIIPCGTGNDLAKSLSIPTDPMQALEVLLTGEVICMDAASANDMVFCNAAGFGFDVEVLRHMRRYNKHFRGILPYLLGLLRAWFALRRTQITLTANGSDVSCRSLIVCAANGSYFGGGMQVAPLADVKDGLLDVCVIHNVTHFTVLNFLRAFVKGRHVEEKYKKYVHYFKTESFTVSSGEPCPVQLDGEIVGTTPVTFRILPGALKVVAGEKV